MNLAKWIVLCAAIALAVSACGGSAASATKTASGLQYTDEVVGAGGTRQPQRARQRCSSPSRS
ncbi:MAG TPA: hypothetical protein VFL17_09360 [Anaerolineae bacterium]|nr:hypothetical protein [Anaerolineae bacterium]